MSRPRRAWIGLIALVFYGCASALPAVRVGDVRALAGQYSGTLKEDGEHDRSAVLVVQPDGQFELRASDPGGFRTVGPLAVAPDGTLVFEWNEMRGRGLVAKGTGTVHEGDGRRAIVPGQPHAVMTSSRTKWRRRTFGV